MKVENMTYNAKTAFTERREIIDKLNECINSINTYGPEKIKDLETKNVQQDSDIAIIETKNVQQDSDIANLKTKITDIETKDTYQDSAIDSLKSASYLQMVTITAHETKISNIETKNAKQDDDINNLKNADTNNVKINKINEYAVGLTGNQDISGVKTYINNVVKKVNHEGGVNPENYSVNLYDFYLKGNDDKPIIAFGHEKSNEQDITRLVISIFANTNIETNKQPSVQIHYIYDEENKKLTLRPAHIDKNGNRVFGTEQTLMTW